MGRQMNRRKIRYWVCLVVVVLSAALALRAADAGLLEAAQRGDVSAVRALLAAKANVSQAKPDGATALA